MVMMCTKLYLLLIFCVLETHSISTFATKIVIGLKYTIFCINETPAKVGGI